MRGLFVTGVGGFIGLAIAKRALARGVPVFGVDHAQGAVERARASGVSASVADICDAGAMQRALADARGIDTVVHTAAIVKEHGALEEFRRVNVGGTLNVARAAQAVGVETFAHLSSVMVYGFDFPADVAEDGPLDGANNPYCQTKIESERELAAFAANKPSFGTIMIRPGDVYGPGSVPWIARPLAMLKKRQLLLPRGGGAINHVFVENLVDGIFLAIDRRAHGGTFNLSDGVATPFVEFYGRLAKLAKLPGPTEIPAGVLTLLTRGLHVAHSLGLTQDDAGPDTVRYLQRKHAYSIARAKRELGYAPVVSLDAGLAATQAFIDAQLGR